jgi:beta-N-acetylhexosaminidase
MLAFDGEVLPGPIARRLARAPAAGLTLFRFLNVRTPGQVLELTQASQAASAGFVGPLLIAADQEGGQLQALGDGPTAFAGNMALGAIDDLELTERVGRAIGTEARAMGVNVVYAPVLDIASNPANPALGIRSFGDDPAAVARHGAAMVRGLQSVGVAATAKHAPGMGHISTDTHHGLAAVDASREMLDAREFVPFRAAFAAGARVSMSGHLALPAITGRPDVPASLARAVQTDLLRGDLGFDGVTITDALDMAAIAQGEEQAEAVVAAVRAGVDLLLAAADPAALERIERALVAAVAAGRFDSAEAVATERRVAALRAWLGAAGPVPDLSLVGAPEHWGLAREVAARAVTLVRDPRGLLPVLPVLSEVGRGTAGGGGGPGGPGPVLAVMPRPTDLTPADTSSTVAPGLARALRRHAADVEEIVVEPSPDGAAIAATRAAAERAGLVLIGTIDAHRQPAQLELVEAIAGTGRPVVAVALRGPWDVAAYPASMTALATYSILPESLEALAAVLAGEARALGRLPVRVAVAGETR